MTCDAWKEVGHECGCECECGCQRGAAAAAIANAIKASGVLVQVEPEDFQRIVHRQEQPLVVHATGGFFSSSDRYLCSYKGLAFYTKSSSALRLPTGCELVEARKIWIPG